MPEMALNFKKYFILLLLPLLMNSSCDKEYESVVPYISFSYSINLTIHNEFDVPGTSVYIPNVGYGGIIVYCEIQGVHYAYDATCTNEVKQSCKVETDGSITGVCSCCGSQYILLGGYPTSGSAPEGLRQYRTSIGGGILRIYNN